MSDKRGEVRGTELWPSNDMRRPPSGVILLRASLSACRGPAETWYGRRRPPQAREAQASGAGRAGRPGS